MKKFKVDLVFESSGNSEKAPSLSVVVSAPDEVEALKNGRLQLMQSSPEHTVFERGCAKVRSPSI